MGLYSGSYKVKINVLGIKELSYVIDFGLPVNIEFNANSGQVVDCWIGKEGNKTGKYGNIELQSDNNTITYTPTSILLDKEEIFVTYKYSVGSGTIYKYKVKIIPASNVLYEENFLTAANGSGWSNGTTSAPTAAQQTQKTSEEPDTTNGYNVFGYDSAYATATGELGVWKATGLTHDASTQALTTTFYGNGFDLIGNCGGDTGRVIMYIYGNGKFYVYDVDTRYNGETLNQVPLVHAELDTDAKYQVLIYAAGLAEEKNISDAAGVSVYAAYSADPVLEQILAENGIRIYDVEYINVSCMTGFGDAAVMTTGAAGTTTVERAAGTHVEIDSFRVYRSTIDAMAMNYYPINEQKVTYTLINNFITSKYIASFKDNILSISSSEDLEGDNVGLCLNPNESFVFNIPDINQIQVSLRTISDSTTWNTENTIRSITEMYYLLDKYDDCFVITNTGDNILEVLNIKSKNSDFVTDLTEDIIKNNIAMSYCYKNQLMDVNYIGLYDSEGQPLYPKEEEQLNE